MNMNPFSPGPTVTLAVTTTTGRVALTGTGPSLEVQNAGAVTMFVKLGSSSVTAAVTDYPILPGQSKVIGVDVSTQTHIAAITASSTATLYATTGQGI